MKRHIEMVISLVKSFDFTGLDKNEISDDLNKYIYFMLLI